MVEGKEVLVEVFNTYGKMSGEELTEQFVAVDTLELRKDLVEQFSWGNDWNTGYFLEGKENVVHIDLDGGDWDEPTGREIVISTREDKLKELESKYNSEIRFINRLFGFRVEE